MDLGAVIIGGVTGNTTFWVGNVGGDPPYGKEPGGVPPPGDKTDHGDANSPGCDPTEVGITHHWET